MLSAFNNREIALYIWILIAVLLCFLNASIRGKILGILKTFFFSSFFYLVAAMVAYVTITVFILFAVCLWDISLLKDVIVWVIGVGFITLLRTRKALKIDNYISETIKENIKLTIIVEFIINFFVFSLIAELLLIPIVTLLALFHLTGRDDPKFKPIAKYFNASLAVIGLCITGFVIYKLINDFENVITVENLKSFLLPVYLTLAYIPFVYGTALFMLYEDFFRRIDFRYNEDTSLAQYTRRRVFNVGGLNLAKARLLSKNLHIYTLESEKAVDKAVVKIIGTKPHV